VKKPKKPKFRAGIRPDIGPYNFRSSWEGNIARWMIQQGIKFEYEPKRFSITKKLSYLPDFKLLSTNPWNATYLEVKGFWRKNDRKRLLGFANRYPQERLHVLVQKEYKAIAIQYGKLIPLWEGYGKAKKEKVKK
jgi:predicted nuclease of restriction endonuclease-like RecB superfamily